MREIQSVPQLFQDYSHRDAGRQRPRIEVSVGISCRSIVSSVMVRDLTPRVNTLPEAPQYATDLNQTP